MDNYLDGCYDMNLINQYNKLSPSAPIRDREDFQGVFCQECKNSSCELARYGKSQWIDRIKTQKDRLLDNPRFADPQDPLWKHIRTMDFMDLTHKAIQYEIADIRGDWEIPTASPSIPILDGVKEEAGEETSHILENAVRTLKNSRQSDEIKEEETVVEEDPEGEPEEVWIEEEPPIPKRPPLTIPENAQTQVNTVVPTGTYVPLSGSVPQGVPAPASTSSHQGPLVKEEDWSIKDQEVFVKPGTKIKL